MLNTREAVRITAQKLENRVPSELRKFSVDPQITSLDELRNILMTAFDIKGDFILSYKVNNELDQEEYFALLSDWDLDAAFLRAYNLSCLSKLEPCIDLKIDIKSALNNVTNGSVKEKSAASKKYMTENQSHQYTETNQNSILDLKQVQTGFQGIFMNQMEKTLNLVSRALNFSDDSDIALRPPLNQTEFLSFLGPVGHVIHGSKLREVVFNGGVDPSFRKVVWKHLLNVYPEGMSGKERLDYMKRKSTEYYSLRDVWRDALQKGQTSNNLTYVTNMVRKDVLRTDRHHKFYSGNDDNQNITSLFNILTTYALYHPVVSYCQGMSDLASPLLVVMANEAHAYICLCALMTRLYSNFLLDGEAMTLKFTHLTESLQIYDPIFYSYLQSQQADDMLFCYRWLLLEMKREFAFEDALHMLEVLWSSLPSEPPEIELSLKEKEFSLSALENEQEQLMSPFIKIPLENAYTKLCAIRRQSSLHSISPINKRKITVKRTHLSLDENTVEICGSSPIHKLKECQSLDENVINLGETSSFCKKEDISFDASDIDDQINHSNTSINNYQNEKLCSVNAISNKTKLKSVEKEIVHKKLIKNLSEFNNFSTNNKDNYKFNPMEREEEESVSSKEYKHEIFNKFTSKNKENFVLSNDVENISHDTHCFLHSNANIHNSEANLTENDGKNISCLEVNASNSHTSVKKIMNVDSFIKNQKSNDDVFVWENPLHENLDVQKLNDISEMSKQNRHMNDYFINNFDNRVVKNSNNTENNINNNSKVKCSDPYKPHSNFFSSMSQELENAKKNCEILLSNKRNTNLHTLSSTISNFQKKCEIQCQNVMNDRIQIAACDEVSDVNNSRSVSVLLPPADVFGGGNPFLIFLCLTVLMQHRDYIMRHQMDYNELAMYFDKMVRKHNVHRVLNQARQMHSAYMKDQKFQR